MEERARISYFFSFISTYIFVREKNSFTYKAVLEKKMFAKKKLTTAHKAIVSYAYQKLVNL